MMPGVRPTLAATDVTATLQARVSATMSNLRQGLCLPMHELVPDDRTISMLDILVELRAVRSETFASHQNHCVESKPLCLTSRNLCVASKPLCRIKTFVYVENKDEPCRALLFGFAVIPPNR